MVTFLIYPNKMVFSQNSYGKAYFSLLTINTHNITEKIVI